MPGASSCPEVVESVSADSVSVESVSADSVRSLVERASASGRPVIGVRPVTDTVKQVDADGFVVATVDREQLRTPVVAVQPDGHVGHAQADLLAASQTPLDLVDLPAD